MKWIREYNSISGIEELSDYLQEIFDEYNLKELKGSSVSYDGTWVITGGTKNDGYPVIFNGSYPIMISVTLQSIIEYRKFYKDLRGRLPNIEKRMGRTIRVEPYESANRIIIKL